MKINRTGTAVEYKKGHYYMTHVEWDDGHCEIEIHRCIPELLGHSCDPNQLEEIKSLFEKLGTVNPIANNEQETISLIKEQYPKAIIQNAESKIPDKNMEEHEYYRQKAEDEGIFKEQLAQMGYKIPDKNMEDLEHLGTSYPSLAEQLTYKDPMEYKKHKTTEELKHDMEITNSQTELKKHEKKQNCTGSVWEALNIKWSDVLPQYLDRDRSDHDKF